MGEIRKIRPGVNTENDRIEEGSLKTDESFLNRTDGGDGLPETGMQEDGLTETGMQEESVQEPGDVEDLYRVYMEEVAAITPCTEEENQKLLKLVKDGNTEARNRLIEGNLRNALFFVQDYIGKGVPMVDLIQEASMELMMLADEGFEDGFEKLLESRIRVRLEEVVREQEKASEAGEEMLARVNVLQEVSKRMAEELGREATLLELSERMKMTEEEVKEIMKVTMDALSLSEANRSLQS